MIDKSTGIHTCDKCHKEIDFWEMHQLVERTSRPGPKHDICSSDININIKKIADLCPECWYVMIAEFVKEE